MVEEEKKLILLKHYFFYVVYDKAREKSSSVVTLFFLCCLWSSKRKNLFSYNIIFCMFSLMKEEKKLIVWSRYFLYIVYDGAKGKTCSVITLFFPCCLWWRKRKRSFSMISFFLCCLWWTKRKNSLCYNIIFFI